MPVIDEMTERDLVRWVARATSDAGFCAREILGYDYDIEVREEPGPGGKMVLREHRVNVGTGGVRDEPPYSDIVHGVQGLDSDNPNFMVLAPRGGYKSSILKGDCVCFLLGDLNRGVLYMSAQDDQVNKRSVEIRKVFETNELIHRMLGIDHHQPLRKRISEIKGVPWQTKEWVFSERFRTNVRDIQTMQTGTLARPMTGGHYDRIYLDDLIDQRNCRNQQALEKARSVLSMVMPLTNPGARVIVAGTRYHPGDIYSHIESLGGWDTMILDCGFEIERTETGRYRLYGTPRFPHLSLDYLQQKANTMVFTEFVSQYMNRHVTDFVQVFSREQFKCVHWDPWMGQHLTVWILVDTATSMKPDACLSAILAVGLDEQRRAYLLDGRVGRFEGYQILEHMFSMHQRWSQKATVGGVTMENVTANQMLCSFLDQEQRRRGIRLNIRTLNRAGNENAKNKRISSLEPRFRAGDLYVVVDTFPRTYEIDGKEKLLFAPDAYYDTKSERHYPGGELVEQFIQHPHMPLNRKDIADCLADIDYTQRDGEQLCYWQRPPASFPKVMGGRELAPRAWRGQDWLGRIGRPPKP